MILSRLWHFFGVIFASSFMYHGYYSSLKRLDIYLHFIWIQTWLQFLFILRRLFVKLITSYVSFWSLIFNGRIRSRKIRLQLISNFFVYSCHFKTNFTQTAFWKIPIQSQSVVKILWRPEVNRFKGDWKLSIALCETVSNTLRRLAPIFQGLTLFVFDAS